MSTGCGRVDVGTGLIGAAHPVATCCWCQAHLVVAQVEQLRCWLCPNCYRRQTKYALRVAYSAKEQKARGLTPRPSGVYCWHVPLPSQVAIYELGSRGGVIVWGARKGPGKSLGCRRWLYWRSIMVPGHESLLLRENWDQLIDQHTRHMAYEVPQLSGRWLEGDKRAVFGKGSDESVITCGHMSEASSITRYQGGNKGAIVCDEGSLYPSDQFGVSVLSELRSVARWVGTDRDGATVHPVMAVPTNPGGPSADYLRMMAIDKAPDYEMFPRLRPVLDEATGAVLEGYDPTRWVYLDAKIDDNPYLPPDYRQQNLTGLSEVKYRQFAEADWWSFQGMFFPEFRESTHVLEGVLM